jgi:acyl-CoA synthetase (AMP-forming)/AMP-acid ligase II
MNIRDALSRAARCYASRNAVLYDNSFFTFEQMWERGCRLANALLSLGLQPQDNVAILSDNTIEAVDFILGAAAANLVRVPLYARNAPDAHGHMLLHAGCRALLATTRYWPDVGRIDLTRLPKLAHRIEIGTDYEDWLASFPADCPTVRIHGDDGYIIRHTGGSTGRPRPVRYTHRMWINACRDWFYNLPRIDLGDVFMHCCPISHGSGYCFLPVWLNGGINFVEPSFDPLIALRRMQEHRVAMTFLVPTMVGSMVRAGDTSGDFRALKCIQVASAPISRQTLLRARDVFGDVIYQLYGQTEALPVTLLRPSEWSSSDPACDPLASVGRPLPFAELEIRDVEHPRRVMPAGEVGEIVVRCDGQMTGFYDQPGDQDRLVDGWVRTGDIGRQDMSGYVYLIDRKGEMLISGGYNIWPAEIESALASHPDIIEVVAFGIPDDAWGEVPYAVCCVRPGTGVTERELIDLCARRLGSYKKPRKVELTEHPLPKTAVGKLSRAALREAHWTSRDRRIGAV